MKRDYQRRDGGFYDFAEAYGEELANDMVQAVCECHYARSDDKPAHTVGRINISDLRSENRSGDRLNFILTGMVDDNRHFVEFEIEDGNNNGTVVHSWERVWKHPAYPLPKTSIWMFQPAGAIATKFIASGQSDLLKRVWDKLHGRSRVDSVAMDGIHPSADGKKATTDVLTKLFTQGRR